jgi:hypothetical protein
VGEVLNQRMKVDLSLLQQVTVNPSYLKPQLC